MKTSLNRIALTLVFTVALCAVSAWAQLDIVNRPVLSRVLRIKYGDHSGSSFAIEVDDRQYLVTAQHVVPDIKAGDSIDLLASESNWQSVRVRAVIHPADSVVDITALALPSLVVGPTSIIPTSSGALLGQDVYFLGFPYNLATFVEGWSPVPFVRRGVLSALSGHVLYIDGMNNPGFSGGPVLFQDYNTHEVKFGGVVQGYKAEYTPVVRAPKNDQRPVEEIPQSELKKTGDFVPENTAIVKVYAIDPIVEAIRKQAVGPHVQR